jgi:hypothetical protein
MDEQIKAKVIIELKRAGFPHVEVKTSLQYMYYTCVLNGIWTAKTQGYDTFLASTQMGSKLLAIVKKLYESAILPKVSDIKNGDFFYLAGGHCNYPCLVVTVGEKAIRVDVSQDSLGGNISPIVYTHTTWLPKSGLQYDARGELAMKPWFKRRFDATSPIRKYYEREGKKVFI